MPIVTLEEARRVLGDDVLGPQEVERVYGGMPRELLDAPIGMTREQLLAARQAGEMLILRVARGADDGPLTVLQMIERYPQAFDNKLLAQMGYQLKDDWGITLEPRAATDTCETGWALVRKTILEESRNLSYEEQDATLWAYADSVGVPPATIRRRSAVEAVYDTVLYHAARGVRLLEKTWDWSSSRTVDGGYLNVGGFSPRGVQVLSFSRAIRHGGLGVCPMRRCNGR